MSVLVVGLVAMKCSTEHCNDEADPPYRLCRECRSKKKGWVAKRVKRLRADGLCVVCGKAPIVRGSRCQQHLDAHSLNTSLRRLRLESRGACSRCGQVPAEPLAPGRVTSEPCLEARRLARKLAGGKG